MKTITHELETLEKAYKLLTTLEGYNYLLLEPIEKQWRSKAIPYCKNYSEELLHCETLCIDNVRNKVEVGDYEKAKRINEVYEEIEPLFYALKVYRLHGEIKKNTIIFSHCVEPQWIGEGLRTNIGGEDVLRILNPNHILNHKELTYELEYNGNNYSIEYFKNGNMKVKGDIEELAKEIGLYTREYILEETKKADIKMKAAF